MDFTFLSRIHLSWFPPWPDQRRLMMDPTGTNRHLLRSWRPVEQALAAPAQARHVTDLPFIFENSHDYQKRPAEATSLV